MRRHPEMVGGEDRDVTELMRRMPGLLAKDGFEGVQLVGLPDGRAIAVKISDGGDRARMPVTIRASFFAIAAAIASAVSRSRAAGTTWLRSPIRSASSAMTSRPV